MSSETLRGIGKKTADGDAAGGGSDGAAAGSSAAPGSGSEKPAPSLADKLGKISERRDKHDEKTTPMVNVEPPREAKPPEAKAPAAPLRSLDSTVPGTRSLDSSVPGAAPSLDARISRVTPPLSATLIGMPAPKFAALEAARKATPAPAPIQPARGPLGTGSGRRDHGTAAGHDVHLPPELQRAAGVQPASSTGPADGTPRVILAAGLTDQAPKAAPASAVPAAEAPRAGDELALGAHNPWYDQLPSAEEVYEDAKPNLVARIAVGVAAAAVLAVLVIAFVRHGSAEPSAEVAPPTPSPSVPGGRVTSPLPPPPAGEAPAPVATAPTPPAPAAAVPAPAAPVAAAPAPAPVAATPPPSPAANVAPKPAAPAPVAAVPAAPAVVPPVKVAPAPVPPQPALAKAELKAESKPEAKVPAKVETAKVEPPRSAPLAAKAAPAEAPRPVAPKVVEARPAAPKPAAPAARPAAAPPRPPVALRGEGAVPARATAPVRPPPATSAVRPAPAAAAAPQHKAPAVAAAPATTPGRPAAHPRTTEGAPVPAKRADRSRQKLLADPDSTLPLNFD